MKNDLASIVGDCSIPLMGHPIDYAPLLNLIGDARIVLLGGATHGTAEFYRARADITKKLIVEKGFMAIALEADWPDAYQVNRHVWGGNEDATARDALNGFKRFPAWMWRNTEVLDFVEWLRQHNSTRPPATHKVGFYGLDLYGLYSAIEAVVNYLQKVDPEAAARARQRYAGMAQLGKDTQLYGLSPAMMGAFHQEDAMTEIRELRVRQSAFMDKLGPVGADEFFFAEQNAWLIKSAESFYRAMFQDSTLSWNLREKHMADTLRALETHLRVQQRAGKIVVWAHNAHIGDARATGLWARSQCNLGQLTREQFGQAVFSVGLTTYDGTITTANAWDAPFERKALPPAMAGSYEEIFHAAPYANLLLDLREQNQPAASSLRLPRLQRSVGVTYQPEAEWRSDYLETRLSEQFDAILHFDRTNAVEPLERIARCQIDDVEETFPTGL